MMLSHPVLLGFFWALLLHSSSGQSQISNNDSNKVYAYSYHFQHNGTTNSKEILKSVLGGDPEFGIDSPDGKSVVKTFSSPNIRGFFTKGVLPAGPLNTNYNSGFNSPFNTNSAIDGIKRVVESNLQPPNPNIATGLLPPISPDIAKEFPGDFNNVNHLGLDFQNQDDFPKIPPPPAPQINTNNHGVSRVHNFAHDTPDGGKVVGKIETFAYNPPPVTNSISRSQESAQGFRRNENILNNNQEVTGHRTQSYFRQEFRTMTPNLEINNFNQNNRIENRNGQNNNNNQWWNVINVLGDGNNNKVNNPNPQHFSRQVGQNIDEMRKNLEVDINRQFGARLSAFRQSFQNDIRPNNRQDAFTNNNIQNNQNRIHNNHNNLLRNQNNLQNNNFHNNQNNVPRNQNNIHNNQNNLNRNFNNNLGHRNQPNLNVPLNNRQNNIYGAINPVNSNNGFTNPQAPNNAFNSNQNVNNYNNQLNKDTERKVVDLIENVNSHLNNLHGTADQRVNNVGLTWDDDPGQNFNDWSRRQPHSNGRPFSNAHSGPLNNPVVPPIEPVDILKTTLEALVGGRNFQIPSISGDQGGNYRNVGGGGVEKFFGTDRVVEGPNSFSRNQQRGYERNFQVNSDTGYQRSNQWSTNTVRRLDAQSSKSDFSKDFIDVFRDDY